MATPQRTRGGGPSRPFSSVRLGASKRRSSRRTSLTPRDERLKSKWDALIDPILAEWRIRPDKGVAPYDQKANYLRREIYRVIWNLRQRSEGKAVIEAAVLGHCNRMPTRLTLTQNPFFWGLKAAADRFDLGPDRVSRLAKEMLYAWRHQVQPDLLIGFILQTGAARIYDKNDVEVESWFSG